MAPCKAGREEALKAPLPRKASAPLSLNLHLPFEVPVSLSAPSHLTPSCLFAVQYRSVFSNPVCHTAVPPGARFYKALTCVAST